MSFPLIESTNTSTEPAAVDTHSIALPTGIISGEFLLALIGGYQLFGDIPAGWARPLVLNHSSDSGVNKVHILTRTADGTEGSTLTFVSTASRQSAHGVYRISGASSFEISTPVEQGLIDDAPNPPSFTPSGGVKDYLWFAFTTGSRSRSVTSAPTNYSNFLNPSTGTSGDSANLGVAARSLNTGTEDPGTFTLSGVGSWVTATGAVFPASGVDIVRVANETLRI